FVREICPVNSSSGELPECTAASLGNAVMRTKSWVNVYANATSKNCPNRSWSGKNSFQVALRAKINFQVARCSRCEQRFENRKFVLAIRLTFSVTNPGRAEYAQGNHKIVSEMHRDCRADGSRLQTHSQCQQCHSCNRNQCWQVVNRLGNVQQ